MPKVVQWLFPERLWHISSARNGIFLTFDDGPIAALTPWVLDQLREHQAKATFFCIGDNIKKNPHILRRISGEGHAVGNHTNNHLNGWLTPTSHYLKNAEVAEQEILRIIPNYGDSKLFRPPYGKMTTQQVKALQKKGYKVVMWDILSFDYNKHVSEEECLQNVIKNIKPGSVIVFHDSRKAEKNLRYALPKVLDHITKQGWTCSKIEIGK